MKSRTDARRCALKPISLVVVGAAILVIGVTTMMTRSPEQDPHRIVGDIVAAGASAFPDGAVVHVSLADVSRQDAESVTIDEVHLTAHGRSAVPFEIRFDPQKLDRRHDYALQVRVTISDRLVFMNTQAVPFQPFDKPGPVEIVVQRVGR